MNGLKNFIFYVLVTGGFIYLMYFVMQQGEGLESSKIKQEMVQKDLSGLDAITDTLHHNVVHPLAILLLQIITIIVTARVFSFLFRKIGQPTVIGEIIAGIFLGPSFRLVLSRIFTFLISKIINRQFAVFESGWTYPLHVHCRNGA